MRPVLDAPHSNKLCMVLKAVPALSAQQAWLYRAVRAVICQPVHCSLMSELSRLLKNTWHTAVGLTSELTVFSLLRCQESSKFYSASDSGGNLRAEFSRNDSHWLFGG